MLTINISLKRPSFQLRVQEQLALAGVTGIMGASGCGKTTLLRCLAGLENIQDSIVCFRDQCWQSATVFLPPEKRRIGYIFQEGRLFPHLDVHGNLLFAQKRQCPFADYKPDLDGVIDWLGLGGLMQRPIGSLSGGQRQRVAIGRALMMAPQLLLMDEPLAALDWTARLSIIPRLRELRHRFGIPAIFVSHDREEMARLADELLLLDDGCIRQRGQVAALLSQSHGAFADTHALSALEGEVVGRDRFGMVELDVDGRRIVLDQEGLLAGERVRVIIPATDVSIALDDSDRISIQNRLQTTIRSVRLIDNQHSLIQLQLDKQRLLALITKRACEQLQLKEGRVVYAHFKATSLEIV